MKLNIPAWLKGGTTPTALPAVARYPWLVVHRGEHPAWYQRAMLAGDFAPGLAPLPHYVLALDGTVPEPSATPMCGTCGEVPRVEDLTPVERATGRSSFLEKYRDPSHPNHRPGCTHRDGMCWELAGHTKEHTCYVCNAPEEELSPTGGYVPICKRCEENLRRGGE